MLPTLLPVMLAVIVVNGSTRSRGSFPHLIQQPHGRSLLRLETPRADREYPSHSPGARVPAGMDPYTDWLSGGAGDGRGR